MRFVNLVYCPSSAGPIYDWYSLNDDDWSMVIVYDWLMIIIGDDNGDGWLMDDHE